MHLFKIIAKNNWKKRAFFSEIFLLSTKLVNKYENIIYIIYNLRPKFQNIKENVLGIHVLIIFKPKWFCFVCDIRGTCRSTNLRFWILLFQSGRDKIWVKISRNVRISSRFERPKKTNCFLHSILLSPVVYHPSSGGKYILLSP